MFLEGRPPVNVGVTSNGDIFGGTADQLRRRARRQAVQLLRRVDLAVPDAVASSYVNLVAALPVRAAGLLADAVLLRPARRRVLRPVVRAVHQPRPGAMATRTVRGGTRRSASTRSTATAASKCPAGVVQLERAVQRPERCRHYAEQYQQQDLRAAAVPRTARWCRSSVAFIQETTMFREFGPLAGSTMRLAYDVAPKIGGTLSRQTFDVDARYYLRLGAHRRARDARPRLQEHGRLPRLHLLRRQLRDARLRLPAVRRPERRVRERRTALPAHRGGADADRRHRRHPRRVLRGHRRRAGSTASSRQPVPGRDRLPVREQQLDDVPGADRVSDRRAIGNASIGSTTRRRASQRRCSRTPTRTSRASGCRTAARRTASASKRSCSASRFTSTGRGGRC